MTRITDDAGTTGANSTGADSTGAPAGGTEPASDELRARAVRRLKKRRDLLAHVMLYVLVNGLLAVIWLMTTPHGFFWPAIWMAFWGIGLIMNAWGVWRGNEFGEDQIAREIQRMQSRR